VYIFLAPVHASFDALCDHFHTCRSFGHANRSSTAGNPCPKGKVACVASHHLNDEGTLMTGCSVPYPVHCINNLVESSVKADCIISAIDIIINRTRHTDCADALFIQSLSPSV